MKKHTLSLQPYDTSVLIVVGTPEEARKWVKTSNYSDIQFTFEADGALISCETYFPVMFLNTKPNKAQRVQTFAHECVHLINTVFDNTGVQYSSGNDEHYAFMMSYLFEQAQTKKII